MSNWWCQAFPWWPWCLKAPPKPITNLKVIIRTVTKHHRRSIKVGTLTGTYPTKRTDGSDLAPTDIASVSFFDSLAPNPNVSIGQVPGGSGAFSFDTGALGPGTHNFTAITTDTAGDVSAVSNVAVGVIALAAPAAITDLAFTP